MKENVTSSCLQKGGPGPYEAADGSDPMATAVLDLVHCAFFLSGFCDSAVCHKENRTGSVAGCRHPLYCVDTGELD